MEHDYYVWLINDDYEVDIFFRAIELPPPVYVAVPGTA
jgi:hypothetical protein